MMKKIDKLFLVLCLFTGIYAQESPHINMERNCETCHQTDSWMQIRFQHDETNFPLLNHHQNIDCKSCHDLKDFAKASANCATCHDDVHQAKMGNDCQRCHTERGWEIFDAEEIHTETQFPLMGAHSLLDCRSCHKNTMQGDFALLTTDCIDCHQQKYLEVQNPNHVSNAFSNNCRECHEPDGWSPAFMPNHDTFFPIFSGEHSGAWSSCVDCHFNPNSFQDFSCTDCHKHRQSSMDNAHTGIGGYSFDSNACYGCHPTGKSGDFKDHDSNYFPIFSGTHNGEWDACETCHTTPNDRSVFSCLECHEHNQTDTDATHSGISGYAYTSAQCYTCHPKGEVGDFKEHDNLYFPIFSGSHRGEWNSCTICHNVPENREIFTCLDCHEHSQSRMDSKHRGEVRNYTYDSNACYNCHPDGREHDD